MEALRASTLLIVLSAFVLGALWGGIAWQIRRESGEELRNAQTDLTNLTRAFAEHTAKTVEGADQALRFARNEYLTQGKDLNLGAYIRDKRIIDSAFHLISVIGPDGVVSHSTQPITQRIDLRDREHFRVHTERSGDSLFVSKPVLGRVSKKWSIQLTRRIDAADGSFGGVVVVSLTPEYFTSFYGDVNLGPKGVITLVGYDGVVRARATHGDTQGAQDLSNAPLFNEAMRHKTGTTRTVSTIDGVDRLWSYRALDDYGLLVVTGMDIGDIMAEARERRTSYVITAGIVTIVVAAFVAGLVWRQRIQLQLMHQLERSNEQANAANVMKTRFLASVSHELRTPLNGILGYSELIRDGGDEAETREYGDAIHASATHLHRLVGDIIDLAKIESGRMSVSVRPVALQALLQPIVDARRAEAEAKGLSLVLDVAADCPCEIPVDPDRFAQVLDQVVGNAVKFSSRGRIEVTVRAASGRLTVAVKDEGRGIAPERLATLFTRFYSATLEAVEAGEGAGLGLPLAYELMVLMRGSITIESRLGAGTTVTLRLPLTTTT